MFRKFALSLALASTVIFSLASATLAATQARTLAPTRIVAPIDGGDCSTGTSFQLGRIVPVCTNR